MIAERVFSWVSKTQRTVALSSTEAEYMALSDCSRQCVWIHSILLELSYNFGPIQICADNQSSIFMANNPITKSRNKHINIRYHAIYDFMTQGKVFLFYIESSENLANIFTKNLGQPKFTKFREQLGLIFWWLLLKVRLRLHAQSVHWARGSVNKTIIIICTD